MKITKAVSISFLFALVIMLSSCNKAPVYEKYLVMKDAIWDRFDHKGFEIPIEKVGKMYDITLSVRFNDRFAYDALPAYLILTTPSGEERMREITMKVRENNKFLGKDEKSPEKINLVIWKSLQLDQTGSCKIDIENMIPKIQTEGIEELGIIVTRSKNLQD